MTYTDLPDVTMTRTSAAEDNISAMALHCERVESAWGKRRPEWALATHRSFGHTMAKLIVMGGRLSADGRLGLFLSSGMAIGIVPRTMLLVDVTQDDDLNIGCWPKDTPYLGRFCFAWFADEPGITARHCMSPIVNGERTCEDDHDVTVMGAPIPVEWSMHS